MLEASEQSKKILTKAANLKFCIRWFRYSINCMSLKPWMNGLCERYKYKPIYPSTFSTDLFRERKSFVYLFILMKISVPFEWGVNSIKVTSPLSPGRPFSVFHQPWDDEGMLSVFSVSTSLCVSFLHLRPSSLFVLNLTDVIWHTMHIGSWHNPATIRWTKLVN